MKGFAFVLLISSLNCLSAVAQPQRLLDQFGQAHQLQHEIFFAADARSRALLLQVVQQISLKQQRRWHWVLNVSKLPYSVINLNLKPSLLRLNTPILLEGDNKITGHWPHKKGRVSLIHPGKALVFFTSSEELLTHINNQAASTAP